MKRITLLIIAFCANVVSAQDFEFLYTVANCISTSEKGKHQYEVGALLRNVSDKKLTIITGSRSTSVQGMYQTPKDFYFMFASELIDKMHDVPLIPSASDLKLVELHPGEGHYFRGQAESKEQVSKARIQYKTRAAWGGRFGNWSGEVWSDYINVGMVKDCKIPKK